MTENFSNYVEDGEDNSSLVVDESLLTRALLCTLSTGLLLVACLGCVLNTVAFTTLVRHPARVKRRTSEIYLIHISLNDWLFSLGLFPQALAMIAKFDLGDTGCKIVLGMTNLNLNASVLFVTVMTIDRYLAVLYGPQKSSFRKWRAKSSVQLQACCIWILSLVLSLPVWLYSVGRLHSTDDGHFSEHPLCGFKYNSHAVALFHCIMRLLCCWLIPSFIILASNIGLLCFLRRRPAVHSKNALNRGFAPQVKLKRQSALRIPSHCNTTRIVSTGRRILTKISAFVTVIVLVCWMPDQILSFYVGVAHEIESEQRDNVPHSLPLSLLIAKYIFKVLLYCTAVINPIIYCFMIRSFQTRLQRVMKSRNHRAKQLLVERRVILSSFMETSLAPVSCSATCHYIRQHQSEISIPFISHN